jgi:hypothetical protein
MSVGYKADALLFQIEASNARTVKPLTLTLSFFNFFVSIYLVVCLSSLCLCLRHVSCVSMFDLFFCVCSVMVKQRKETKRVKDKVGFIIILLHFNFYCYLTIVSLFKVV